MLYGDALSKQDLDGKALSSQPTDPQENITLGKSQNIDAKGGDFHESSLLSIPSNHEFPGATIGTSTSRQTRGSRHQPTDCHNPTFDEQLRNRDPNVPRIDRLEEQRVSKIINS